MMENPADFSVARDGPADLAALARQGDPSAFGAMVRENEGTLYRVARTVLPGEQDCADAVQEALIRAWLNIGTLREPRFFRTWLIRILLNECYRQSRRKKRIASERQAPAAGDAISDEAIDLRAALARLPVEHRVTLVLYHLEDLEVKEIARLMQVPAGTVKSRLARARAKLAAHLD